MRKIKINLPHQMLKKEKTPVVNLFFLMFVGIIIVLSIWGPELLEEYRDKSLLNKIHMEEVPLTGEGYRYALEPEEKLYILSEAISSHLSRNQMAEQDYQQIADQEYQQMAGTYAFIVNHRGPYEKQITNEGIYDSFNKELARLKQLKILPDSVEEVEKDAYSSALYSAIDVLEPRKNVTVWKLSLSGIQKNISRQNKLIDAYIDADDGKICEFYVRTEWDWEETNPDELIKAWSRYMGLQQPAEYEEVNPLMESTPYFKKYIFQGKDEEQTIVTIGFYEGINELFLKVSR